jgi:uncharacterized protein
MFLLAAISLGFLGSFHCIGMCGPIALSIPVKRSSPLNIVAGSLMYNVGRMTTYAAMGLLFGLLGQGFALAGWQNILSVSLGIIILVFLFLPKLSWISKNRGLIFRLLEKLKFQLRKLFGIYALRSLLLIGLLNGLLPCGLVYLGIAGSIATGDTLKGALFMAAFGLGTLPGMMAITIVRDSISIHFREKIRKAIPVFVGLMATLLILRGLSLGIPYVSPSVEVSRGACHHQCCPK